MKSLDDLKTACQCCEGTTALTPASLDNRPGLSALAYRVGTHAAFKETMLAGISAKDALRALTTRDDDDPSVALLDSWATVLDVLTFYQERIANEGFLRTALERRSLLEMARAIGYKLRPGVAATAALAFTLDDGKDSPGEITIDAGTGAKSIPGADELPQTFETIEEITARPVWNALRPQSSEPVAIGPETREAYLKGAANSLDVGDAVLVVGDDRKNAPDSAYWNIRVLSEVESFFEEDLTRIAWKAKTNLNIKPGDNTEIHVFRRRAALFGHNAPDWKTMPKSFKEEQTNNASPLPTEWPTMGNKPVHSRKVDLDAVYPKILPGGWVVLQASGSKKLYEVKGIKTKACAEFTLTGKVSRLTLDADKDTFGIRETVVFAESELLEVGERPVTRPVAGNAIVLDGVVEGLESGRTMIVRGKRARAEVGEQADPLSLVAEDGSTAATLSPGEALEVLALPADSKWRLRDGNGVEGTLAVSGDITLTEAGEDDEFIGEAVTLDGAASDKERTTLTLEERLENVYDRASTTVLANVAPATHGESKSEILGSADASKAFQKFQMKQAPLTYVPAPVPSGGESTLKLRLDGVEWREAADFHRLGPKDRNYVLTQDDDANTTVQFGDGVNGARPPSGIENIEASYRVGIGAEGMVGAERISLLSSPPLGVKGVINPMPASGGQDSDTRDDARRNAPVTVLTLDRIVSLQDFEDFAYAFSGIDKALATWLWDGETRLIHITVAAPGGRPVSKDSALYENLLNAMNRSRDPFQGVLIDSFAPVTFKLEAKMLVHPDTREEDVKQAVEERLRRAYSFDERDFGQTVSISEVAALIHEEDGVAAVDVDALYPAGQLSPSLEDRIFALPALLDKNKTVQPAQLLTLSPEPLTWTPWHE